ncbi:MAG: hypothetical protein RIS47_1169 [Bacteroidota bacterium]|jgi:hypothetical protein
MTSCYRRDLLNRVWPSPRYMPVRRQTIQTHKIYIEIQHESILKLDLFFIKAILITPAPIVKLKYLNTNLTEQI